MIHRTFRSLDDAPKLVGFTIRQWLALILACVLVLGFVQLTRIGAKPAITIGVFVIGLPAALTYVSESGGLQLERLLADMWRWRVGAKHLQASRPGDAAGHCVLISPSCTQREQPRATAQPSDIDDAHCWERWQ